MFNIAIDGPSGAGKSSAARAAAEKLGYIYIDTGALYRAVGCAVMRKGLDIDSKNDIISVLPDTEVSIKFSDGEQRVFLNGEDISDEIRYPAASLAASKVSAVPEVRSFLFELQKNFAEKNNCLMDGRDIGTVVLPQAQLKIFLTASPEIRAERRLKQLAEKGIRVDYCELLREIEERDYNDSHRAASPLTAAADAVLIDSSELTFEQTVDKIVSLAREVCRK